MSCRVATKPLRLAPKDMQKRKEFLDPTPHILLRSSDLTYVSRYAIEPGKGKASISVGMLYLFKWRVKPILELI